MKWEKGLGAHILHHVPLSERFVHGFTGIDLAHSDGEFDELHHRFAEFMGYPELLLLKQVHGAEFVDLRKREVDPLGERPHADAWIFPLESPYPKSVGVITADCLPVLLVGEHFGAAIHAGWRGFAAGVVEAVLEELLLSESASELVALVGPAASGMCYEVGKEVLEAIGERAIFKPKGGEKYLLDLPASAERLLRGAGITRVVQSGTCTMSDERFYSYRRNGKNAGRNVAFCVQRKSGSLE